jgi:hypothetical protein
MDQLQFDPGSIPEASTSDIKAATEGAVEGAATTTATGAGADTVAGGVVGGGVVTRGVTADVEFVVTAGATTGKVVVVVW